MSSLSEEACQWIEDKSLDRMGCHGVLTATLPQSPVIPPRTSFLFDLRIIDAALEEASWIPGDLAAGSLAGRFHVLPAAVIPVLHDQFGSPLESGLVTQRVTVSTQPAGSRRRSDWAGMVFVEQFEACSLPLEVGNRVADRDCPLPGGPGCPPSDARPQAGTCRDVALLSAPRPYLWVSTIQWLTNHGLLAVWTFFGSDFPGKGTEKPQVLERSKDSESPL